MTFNEETMNNFHDELARRLTVRRERAHEKHGANSIEANTNDDRFFVILTEEVGEVAMAINDRIVKGGEYEVYLNELRGEIMDTMTVCAAWLQVLEFQLTNEYGYNLGWELRHEMG